MNLILIKPNERSTSTTNTTASGVNDGANSSSSSSSVITVDLSPNDERTKHLLHHLHKQNGDSVSVGFIDSYGGWKCKAVIQYYCPTIPIPILTNKTNNNTNNDDDTNDTNNNTTHGRMGVRLLVPTSMEPSIAIKQSHSSNIPQITILLAVPFPSRLKYLWPVMASFISVTRIIIVQSTLSNPEFIQSKALHPTVYQPLIEKGMSQGGRTRPIQVDICVGDTDYEYETISKSLLERLGLVSSSSSSSSDDTTTNHNIARIFLDCGDENEDISPPPPAREVVLNQCCRETTTTVATPSTSTTAPSAIIAIGPERGWTDNEANVFVRECGFKSATLGSSILRVDTAVVSAVGMVTAALDECYHHDHHRRQQVSRSSCSKVDDDCGVAADDGMSRKRKSDSTIE
jgi:16S rRNA U1498 N3-methylase RsmE